VGDRLYPSRLPPGVQYDIAGLLLYVDMHPMFKELFLQADADDLLAEEDRRRRRVSQARRARPATGIRPAAGNGQRQPRP
jgi:hypothetical protein